MQTSVLSTLDYTNRLTFFPSQKLATKDKDDDWAVKCIESAYNLTLIRNEWVRQSQHNKAVNYDLSNDILDEEEIHKVFNPMGIKSGEFPAAIMHYNISMSKINLLAGEELKRRFDYKVVCLDEDVQANKDAVLKDKLYKTAVELIKDTKADNNTIQQRIKDLDKYMKYTYTDIKELTATRILRYLWYEQKLKYLFNKGFYDLLIAGEELYRTDIVGGNPIVERVNPLHLFTLRNGVSHRLEDAEIILEMSYQPIGRVIEEFYDELSDEEVDYLETGYKTNSTANQLIQSRALTPIMSTSYFFDIKDPKQLLEPNDNAVRMFGGWFNEYGEVRVMRVRWKSRLKRYKRKYYDENGDTQYDIVSEFYKADKAAGEELTTIWVNEWWEGTKIADNIYVKVRPRPVQFRNMSNPAKASSGYVGTYSNINSSKVMSLMDRMKPFQYLYNIFMRRFELAFAQYKAPILQLNQTLMPDNWETDKWLYYANVLGILLIDPFTEVNKGIATGDIAGRMNTFTNDFLNPQMGNYIQLHVTALQYIENMLGKISGVTDAREGQQNYQESVGGTERKVTQSTYITEGWFNLHDDTKKRVLEHLLETAKYAYKGKRNKSVPYILDDMSIASMEIDTEQFNSAQYNIHVSDMTRDTEIFDILKNISQASIQNGGSVGLLIDVLRSDSISDISRRLKNDEEEKIQNAQEQEKMKLESAQKLQQEQLSIQLEENEKDRQLDREKMMLDYEIAVMNLEKSNETEVNDGEDFEKQIKERETKLKELKQRLEENKAEEDKRKNKVAEEIKREELVIKKRTANKPNKTK